MGDQLHVLIALRPVKEPPARTGKRAGGSTAGLDVLGMMLMAKKASSCEHNHRSDDTLRVETGGSQTR
jgi:hypothetical protein